MAASIMVPGVHGLCPMLMTFFMPGGTKPASSGVTAMSRPSGTGESGPYGSNPIWFTPSCSSCVMASLAICRVAFTNRTLVPLGIRFRSCITSLGYVSWISTTCPSDGTYRLASCASSKASVDRRYRSDSTIPSTDLSPVL